jgi:hypothetical protein
MIMMSLVPHRLNHDMPEHLPNSEAYCQEINQPKDKCCFVNKAQQSLLKAQTWEASTEKFSGKELTY